MSILNKTKKVRSILKKDDRDNKKVEHDVLSDNFDKSKTDPNEVKTKSVKRQKFDIKKTWIFSKYIQFDAFRMRFLQNFGWVTVKVVGVSKKHIIASTLQITSIKIVSENKTKNGHETIFVARAKQVDKIIAKFESLCYNYLIIKYSGVLWSATRLLSRAGIVLALSIVVVSLVLHSYFVQSVSVKGLNNSDIDKVLMSYGITDGAFLFDDDLSDVAHALTSLDGVAYASVKKRGSHVEVEIKQEMKDPFFVDTTSTPLMSKHRAVVSRIVVYSGTACVAVGDVVDERTVMIDNYVLYGEDKIDVGASGEVYGIVTKKETIFFADEIYHKTVKSVVAKTFVSFDSTDEFDIGSVKPNTKIEKSVYKNDFLIPYYVHTYTATEYEIKKQKNVDSNDEISKIALTKVAENLGFVSLDTSRTKVGRVQGGRAVDVVVTYETRID